MKFRVLGYNIQQGQTLVDIHILGEDEGPEHNIVIPLADHEPLTLNGLKLVVELGLQKTRQRRDNLNVVGQAYREGWVLDTEELEDQSGCPACVDGECRCGGDSEQAS